LCSVLFCSFCGPQPRWFDFARVKRTWLIEWSHFYSSFRRKACICTLQCKRRTVTDLCLLQVGRGVWVSTHGLCLTLLSLYYRSSRFCGLCTWWPWESGNSSDGC
jgi:hypothetical protein